MASLLAACVILGLGVASSARAQEPTAPTNLSKGEEESRLAFNRGKGFYASRNFEDALTAFRAAVASYPSPNAQLLAARCLRELGRLGEAVLAYEDAVVLAGTQAAERPEYAQARDAAAAELAELAQRVGRVRVEVLPADVHATVRMNGAALPDANGVRAWPAAPGPVTVEVSAPGYVTARRDVTVSAATEVRVAVTLEKPADPRVDVGNEAISPAESPSDTDGGVGTAGVLAWTSVAVAAVGTAGFVLFYLLADGQQDDYRAACVDQPCTDGAHADLASTGETYQTLTNVSLVTGLVGLAAAAVFFIVDGGDDPSSEHATGVRARVTGSSAQLEWRF